MDSNQPTLGLIGKNSSITHAEKSVCPSKKKARESIN